MGIYLRGPKDLSHGHPPCETISCFLGDTSEKQVLIGHTELNRGIDWLLSGNRREHSGNCEQLVILKLHKIGEITDNVSGLSL